MTDRLRQAEARFDDVQARYDEQLASYGRYPTDAKYRYLAQLHRELEAARQAVRHYGGDR